MSKTELTGLTGWICKRLIEYDTLAKTGKINKMRKMMTEDYHTLFKMHYIFTDEYNLHPGSNK